jgi:hypothetical protein
VLRGRITTTDASGARETVNAGDLFYWPPGHNITVEEDADFVMFSPESEHRFVVNHMLRKVEQS